MEVVDFKLIKFKAEKWRNLKDIEFPIGNKLTLISGHNGVGKSNLLGLLASSSGLRQSNLNSNFHPEIYDFFYIDKSEMENDYKCFNFYKAKLDNGDDYFFTKRLRLKDDTIDRGQIRIIPETYKYPLSDTRSISYFRNKVRDDIKVGPEARVSMPTLILSLSRLLPLGESKADYSKVARNASIFEYEANSKYKEWYNTVLPNSIVDDNLFKIEKEATNSKNYSMNIVNTMPLTQSVGQDSLSNIVHALVEFYLLKKTHGYISGLLCIDEVDVSLHPDAQIRLISLLDLISSELNLQIILSSHSLTTIKEISRLKDRSNTDYSLVYLKDSNSPYVSKRNDYQSIKLDLYEKIYRPVKPKIKVYFEDDMGCEIFLLLKDVYFQLIDSDSISDNYKQSLKNLEPDFNIVELIPTSIGCNTVFSLIEADKYFQSVCFLLDGDAKISKDQNNHECYLRKKKTYNEFLDNEVTPGRYSHKKSYDNVIYLPSYFPPEFYLYRIIYKYIKNISSPDYYMFWRNLEDITVHNYTSTALSRELRISDFNSSGDNLTIDVLKGTQISSLLLEFC
ncbi:MAG: ATP-binding protein [Tissierella sp.]|nr:ATP-binding protein [Tissierella sp.]